MSGSDPALETAETAETVGTAEIFETSAEFDWDHPENDPSHPRYEPPHLRHRPGDTWQIGGKPFDIEDRGPYGNPLWRPDRRTGRHRRGELPDPLPPETEPETGPEPEPGPTPPPIADHRTSPPPVASPRPSPGPARRGFWTETDPGQQHPDHVTGRDHHRSESDTDHPEQGGGYRFDRLREDAWDHFMTDSAPLAAAHTRQPRARSPRQTAFEREAGGAWALWIALAKWLFALLRSGSNRQGDGLRPSFCSLGHAGSSIAVDPAGQGPQAAKGAAPPLTLPARQTSHNTTTAATMARAIAGARRARAQRPRAEHARAGVASWA